MKKRNCKVQSLSLGGIRVVASDCGPKRRDLVATGDERNNLMLWRIGQEDPLTISETIRAESAISCLKFTAEGSEMMIGSSRGVITLWDLEGSRAKLTLKGHTINVTSLATSPHNRNIVASGAYDTKVKVWDLRTKNNLEILKGHTMEISCMEVSPDMSFLVSGSKDCTARLWDFRAHRLLHAFTQHEAPVNCIRFNPDRMLVSTGGNDRQSRQWELDDIYSCVTLTKTETTPVQALLYTHDGEMIFTCSNDSLKLWALDRMDAVLLDNI
jgi:katanin p80 WD40 repeat-containing subunit B1